MKKNNAAIAALMGLGMLAAPAIAQADSIKDKLDNLQISGFVDSAFFKTNAPGTSGGITLDQVELDVEYSSGNVGMRFDLQVTPSTNATMTSDQLIEQGYVYYKIPDVATFTFGKFNAPIGWELLDAPDMYQYSHALVFDNGLMTNLVGASVSSSFADGMVDVVGYIANGTDFNGANNTGNGATGTFGGRLGVTPMEGVNIGLSFARGDNNAGVFQAQKFHIFDVDATIEVVDNLLIGAEYNRTKNWTALGALSNGWFVTGHYDFSDMFGTTLRYGTFNFDKSLSGYSKAITGAVTASLGDGLGALFEVRRHQNTAVATNAGLAGNTSETSFAFEMTYGF